MSIRQWFLETASRALQPKGYGIVKDKSLN